jgi:hypothetical protein
MKSVGYFIAGVVVTLLFMAGLAWKRPSMELQLQRGYEEQVKDDLLAETSALKEKIAEIQNVAPLSKPVSDGSSHSEASGHSTFVIPGHPHPLLPPNNDPTPSKPYQSSVPNSPPIPTETTVFRLVQKPEWQINIDWSFGNSDAGGATNCPSQYFAEGVWTCVVAGGRGCVMLTAKDDAKDLSNLNKVFDLTMLTQCHNPDAQNTIRQAGNIAVFGYVKNHR